MTNHDFYFERYKEKGLSVIQSAPSLYIDVDVEADGKAGYGSMLSIGGVSPFGDEFYCELKPLYDRWLEPQKQFCEAHGLERERLLDEGIEPLKAIKHFVEWTKATTAAHAKNKPVFTAFNASFDFPWID